MRYLLSILLTAILAAAAEYFLPWWTMAVVAFIVSMRIGYRPGRSFLMGFCGIAVFWLIAILLRDIPNDHILSTRMATLFSLPGYLWFSVVTILLGGLVGGLAALAGSLLRKPATGI